jgi:uncharacterized protein (TIGR02588 family)
MAQQSGQRRDMRSLRQRFVEMPFWESAIGVLGVVLVLSVIGFLLFEQGQASQPPNLWVYSERTIVLENGYLVQIQTYNSGGQTAAEVVVEGSLKQSPEDNEPIDSAQITLDFVPPDSSRAGGLIFRENPDDYVLDLRVKGYVKP